MSHRCATAAMGLVLAACPAKGTSTPRRDGGDAGGGVAGDAPGELDGSVAATAGVGRVSVTVVWPTAPATVRASPGYTACHTPRRARAQIGTLHGVAGAFVVIADLPAAAADQPAAVRLTVRDCAVEPAAVAAQAGGALEIQTQDGAHAIWVERTAKPWLEDDGTLAPVTLSRSRLPVLGHTVTIALDEPGAIRVVADGAADDAAWVLAPPHRLAGVTDDVGALGLPDVPAGAHEVVAWLPPRAGQAAQRVSGNVTVVAGKSADLTLTIGPAVAGTPPAPPPPTAPDEP